MTAVEAPVPLPGIGPLVRATAFVVVVSALAAAGWWTGVAAPRSRVLLTGVAIDAGPADGTLGVEITNGAKLPLHVEELDGGPGVRLHLLQPAEVPGGSSIALQARFRVDCDQALRFRPGVRISVRTWSGLHHDIPSATPPSTGCSSAFHRRPNADPSAFSAQ